MADIRDTTRDSSTHSLTMETTSNSLLIVRAVALLCLLTDSLAEVASYCDEELCSDEKHIACGNDNSFSDKCPAGAKLVDVDGQAQQAIVAAHNEVRQQWASGRGEVSVNACRMVTISWDPELARLAELAVKQCVMQHDCHNTEKFQHSGQNLFTAGYSGVAAPNASTLSRTAVLDWAKEGEHIKATYIDAYPDNYSGPTIGHATIVIGESNVAVGCAIANYLEDEFDTFLVACNYATSNFIDWPVYTTCQQPAEKCKSGSNPDYPALCSTSEDVDYNLER